VALPLACLMSLLFQPGGVGWTLLVVIGCKLNDVAAYLVGSSLPAHRRHRMCPGISPNKSWEGAAAGLVVACAGMIALRSTLSVPWDASSFIVFAAALSVAAQLGDLLVSVIMRAAGV
jgi:phosphatidate cytidylyltransferase